MELARLALLVPEYDEAIAYYTGALGFTLVEDTTLAPGKRFVVVSAGSGATLLLVRASGPEQVARIGDQTGGRVFLFLHTDDFWRDYNAFAARGVRFTEAPRHEAYGTVVVFADRYGNLWDLVQPT